MKKTFDLDKMKREKEALSLRLKKMETFLQLAEELEIESVEEDGLHEEEGDNSKRKITIKNSKWDKKLPFRKKVLAVLNEAGRYSHVKQLAEIMRAHGEPEYIKGSKNNLQTRISAALTALKVMPGMNVTKFAEEGGSVKSQYWGFTKWDENNKIKSEYMYVKD